MLKKVVFLDRDGVINHDSVNYIKKLEEFIFIPGSLSAIRKLNQYEYSVFIITNQSGVARKIIDPYELNRIHKYMIDSVINAGGCIGGIYLCPHHPDDKCNCRKPRAGLIYEAALENHIDISSSIMVGDKFSDIECAKIAGCKYAFLVGNATENGKNSSTIPDLYPYFYRRTKTLFHTVDIIIAEDDTRSEKA